VLYRLPELLSADPAEAIYVVEGEKDVDRLRTLGFVATTNVGGASKSKNGRSKWKPEYSQSLKGRDVVILPDNDDVGSNHAKAVAASLVGVARSVKVLRLPDLPPKGDVSDFFESGGRADQLRRLAADSPEWMPATMAAVSSDDELSLLTPRGRTDVANAKRFVAAAGQDVRWCDPWGKWLGWDGTRWAIDRHRVIESKAKASAAAMWAMIAAIANQLDDGEAEGLLRYARASSSAVSIRNAIALARSEPGLPVLPEMLDCDPFLLNMENGTIDLRNGDIRDHRKSDYLTKVSPVRFNPAAACPIWLQTLETITNGNSELQAFLQRAIGLSLTGDCSEHALFFCFGNGANGKSTVLNTVQKLLGPDYAMKAPPDLLLSKGRDSHPTERADLAGKRFVACIEAGEGRRMAESLVKELTGGDPVRARRMREDFWEFDPTHKIWLAANHKPKITGVDNGIWRRVKLVPFTVQIPDHEQDKQLPHKLEAELPGIFNWAIRGCLEWQRIGLAEPAAVTEATAGYKREADTIGAYLVECCEEQTGSHVGATQLYKLFKIWSGSEMSQQAFGRAMSERGFDDGRYGSGPNKGRKCWMHIKLIDNPAETGECNGE
jgi:putative DNA primase/helicase